MRNLLLAGLLLAGAGLRARPLTANRFHPDEALYAHFGRLIATGRDPLLASVVADKPPLAYYAVGASMAVFGATEFAARLPDLFASVVSVALLYALARRLYGASVAVSAAAIFALSPFAISFAPTAFIDPLQLVFLLWALAAAARGRWLWCGVAAGLALATKQTTVAFLPLMLWKLRNPVSYRHRVSGPMIARLARFLGPVALAAVLATVWDASRGAQVGFWQQGLSDNIATRFVTGPEAASRLAEIVHLLSFVTAAPLVYLLGGAGLALLWRPGRRLGGQSRADVALAAFIAVYLSAYWLLAFNLWDRYLLVLVPLVCLLLARGAVRLAQAARAPAWLAAPVLAVLLLPGAITAARSGFPIGGDHGAYDGIDEAAAYLRQMPKGDVLYDHWLSWELQYYLDDAPIYMVWLPGPATLAADLRSFGRTSPRYFVTPSWENDTGMQSAARRAGFAFQPVMSTTRRDGSTSFTVYRLVPAGG